MNKINYEKIRIFLAQLVYTNRLTREDGEYIYGVLLRLEESNRTPEEQRQVVYNVVLPLIEAKVESGYYNNFIVIVKDTFVNTGKELGEKLKEPLTAPLDILNSLTKFLKFITSPLVLIILVIIALFVFIPIIQKRLG